MLSQQRWHCITQWPCMLPIRRLPGKQVYSLPCWGCFKQAQTAQQLSVQLGVHMHLLRCDPFHQPVALA